MLFKIAWARATLSWFSVPGVYISYPFCAQKCSYCNFASGVFPREWEPRYRVALASEIARQKWAWRPETVYLGGGTPSTLEPGELSQLLAAIPGKPWIEATIEAAPGTITLEKARGWMQSGINRVSLGVQSFVEREIARTGRKHTAEIVEREVALLREAGIANMNIDLIAGLAGQSAASWQQSLDWIERLSPPHVSIYMLEVDDDSRLGHEILLNGKRYGAPDAPSGDLTAEMYETAVARLKGLGILRYEISNFARRGFESKHNLKYWRFEPYCGFGADAHSFDGARRWQNVEAVQEYLESDCLASPSTAANHAEEKFFVGLRLSEGVRPDIAEWARYDQPIRRFLDAGLLESENGTLRLTDRGVLLSNEVFQEFLTAC
jgi:oxygen-independent coproporphyrinogen-3 oxidase